MQKKQSITDATLTALLALSAVSPILLASDAIAAEDQEKCYGIVKAGMNDCQTATAACAGSAVKDNQSDAFLLVPKDLCQKIVGGSLQPPKDENNSTSPKSR